MSNKSKTRGALSAGTAMGLPSIAVTTPGAVPTSRIVTLPKSSGRMHLDRPWKPDGLTEDEARRERAIAEAVRRLLEDLSREHGSIVRDIKVTPPTTHYWKKMSVQMKGYGDHGVPQHIIRQFDIAPKREINEDQIMVRVAKEYERFFAKQRDLAARYGGPVRDWTVNDINLSLYSIEAPVWRYLEDRLGATAEAALRRILLAGDKVHEFSMRHAVGIDMGDLRITTSRGLIRGEFTLKQGAQTVKWRKGSIMVEGLSLTETVAQSVRGQQLADVVAHPFFRDHIVITSAQPSTRKDRQNTVLDTREGTLAMPVTAA